MFSYELLVLGQMVTLYCKPVCNTGKPVLKEKFRTVWSWNENNNHFCL